MKVAVDTAHDSEEDIRKVIAMLKHFVGDEHLVTNAAPDTDISIESSPSQEDSSESQEESGAAFASMFNDTSALSADEEPETSELEQDVASETPEEETQEDEGTQNLFDDLFSDDKPKDADEDGRNPKIQLY